MVGALDVDTWDIFVRFDQRTSITGEVAERIGALYRDGGFRFAYFDGAEDVHPPYWFNVSWPQWQVFTQLQPAPLFAEGAAKTHFSWHILSRGNAFDIFAPEKIRAATVQHPMREAPLNAADFTSLNFGWIGYAAPGESSEGLQPDQIEFVASRAAAWDAPLSLEGNLAALAAHPRTPDNLEVIRRWEDARLAGTLTGEEKTALRSPTQEHVLLRNEAGGVDLVPYAAVPDAASRHPQLRVFELLHGGVPSILFWHTRGEGVLEIDTGGRAVTVTSVDGAPVRTITTGRGVRVPLGPRRLLQVRGATSSQLREAIARARVLPLPDQPRR